MTTLGLRQDTRSYNSQGFDISHRDWLRQAAFIWGIFATCRPLSSHQWVNPRLPRVSSPQHPKTPPQSPVAMINTYVQCRTRPSDGKTLPLRDQMAHTFIGSMVSKLLSVSHLSYQYVVHTFDYGMLFTLWLCYVVHKLTVMFTHFYSIYSFMEVLSTSLEWWVL